MPYPLSSVFRPARNRFGYPKNHAPKNARLGVLLSMVLSLSMVSTASHAISLSDVFGKSGSSATATSKPLPVSQAFNVVPMVQGDKLVVDVRVTEGYYAYKDKLAVTLPDGVSATPFVFNQVATYVDDPEFGRVPVFDQSFTATATLSSNKAISNQPATLKWQGCAKSGLCYPPEKVPFTIDKLAASGKAMPTAKPDSPSTKPTLPTTQAPIKVAASTVSPTANTAAINTATGTPTASTIPASVVGSIVSSTSIVSSSVANTSAAASAAITVPVANTAKSIDLSFEPTTDQTDPFGLTEHLPLALLLLFLAGLGLAFTPCVLPMLPIVANIVARQHHASAKKGFLLTGSYGLGVATSYGLIGAIVAVFGQSLGIMNWLQNPVVLLSFAALFALLGLYMLDWLPIRLPASWTIRLQRLTQVGENRLGSVSGSFITGFFSALVVSPCVSAPLAGAVAGVAALGNPVLGFVALFLLGLGLSTPLMILGATQGNIMPKAGEWMNWVKKGFALLLFAVALLMLERVYQSSTMLLVWALWFAVIAMWAWQWSGRGQMFSRGLGLLLGGWMLCLLLGVASGSKDSWQPLAKLTNQSVMPTTTNTNRTITVKSLAELQPLIASNPNVLVDVTADWCIECRIMDKTLFANPPSQLANWQVVKLDVTEDSADSKAVYKALKVFGPPVFLYYQNGQLTARQNGEVKREDFEALLTRLD